MSLLKVFDTAASGLSAQNLRLNLISSNLANAHSVSSSVEDIYRARHPVFAALVDEYNPMAPATGVRMLGVVESDAPLHPEYAPDHPLADAEGMIYRSNVNIAEEMANMISASRTYQSNVEVVNSAKQMISATLRMGQ